jgi:hypothetical protein
MNLARPLNIRTAAASRLFVCCLAASLLGITAASAQAAFPGANGKIAFVDAFVGGGEIYVLTVGDLRWTNLTNSEAREFGPTWSADGGTIAFLRIGPHPNPHLGAGLYTIQADGTGERLVASFFPDLFSKASWSPDGTRIAFQGERAIYTIGSDGTGRRAIADAFFGFGSPAWSPGGDKIAFSKGSAFTGFDIYTVDPNGGNLTQVTDDPDNELQPTWSPDGQRIAYRSFCLEGEPCHSVSGGIYTVSSSGSDRAFVARGAWPAWSPDGTQILYECQHGLCTRSPSGGGEKRVSFGGFQPDWQPVTNRPSEDPVFVIVDEDSIDNGGPPNFHSDRDVNDQIAKLALRSELPFFNANEGQTISLHTGQVGDEGWFAPKAIPAEWASGGPTTDGLRNYVGDPSQPYPHNVGPGLGTGQDPEKLLDKVPAVSPLRATGLGMLEGKRVCALVYNGDVGVNYGPLNVSLKGANLGTVAFEVGTVTPLAELSSSSLPQVEVEILDAEKVCEEPLQLFTESPEPTSSSEPPDTH